MLRMGGVRVGLVRAIELPPVEAAIAVRWFGTATVIAVHYLPGTGAARRRS